MKYTVYQLADDRETYGNDASKFIVTTSDFETEVSGPMRGDDADRFARVLNALDSAMKEIDSEIEQRQHGGNDEDWIDLKRISDEGHAALWTARS